MSIPELDGDIKIKFLSSIDRSGGNDACWPFLLSTNQDGYGRLWVPALKKLIQADRLALYYDTGIMGLCARHKCDNPICCNPSHLTWGTKRENSRDALSRKRAYIGERNPGAVLSEHVIKAAMLMRQNGISWSMIATELSAHPATIWHACNIGWKHLRHV